MTRAHTMRFGAQYHPDATAFRLWAPAAARVDLVLDSASAPHDVALQAVGDGWFECRVDDVAAGDRYAFRIDGRLDVPDPASRANPEGVHAKSQVVDPSAYHWRDAAWRGRPWHEAVVYELHIGTFTAAGTFAAAIEHLDALADLGVTAVELMPLGAFAGTRNWGYDGVLPFAPAACYGSPDDLKRLIDAAHARDLMMLVDVVYNHFGPDGNYLHAYAPQFFTAHHRTPWGDAINFDGDASATVREFFIDNALYWLNEFHFDGLRLDAVHAIADDSRPDFVTELATRVREQAGERHVHLVLENDRNEARYLRRDDDRTPLIADAQWNDDLHHALHTIATGERDGYYEDYASRPAHCFARALAEGFVYQGEPSAYRAGKPRGEPSGELPPTAFVSFAQDHDQIGNRAFGERLSTLANSELLRALVSCVLLAPQVPMLFMGEEFGASTPFLFFCDFEGELAQAVTNGRRGEFARFLAVAAEEQIPDPNAVSTFEASKLDWSEALASSGVKCRAFYRQCLSIRRRRIVPLLQTMRRGGSFAVDDQRFIRVSWCTDTRAALHLVANLSQSSVTMSVPAGEVIYACGEVPAAGTAGVLGRYGVTFIVGYDR